MTTVTIFQDQDGICRGFTCEGHSGYAAEGDDIVCASVSALVITAVNSIEQFTEDDCRSEADEKHTVIRFFIGPRHSHDADLIIRSMILGLKEIEESYGSYLQILFEEV